MLTLYIACLIFGGLLLGFSFFGGGEHDSDTDHSLDSGHDGGGLLDSGTDTSIEHSGDLHSEIEPAHHSTTTEAAKFFSFRNAIFFIAFFGLTGTVLELLSTAAILTFIFSSGMGSFAWFTGFKIMNYLKQSESGETLNIKSLKGRQCVVSLNVSKNQKGKILVDTGGQRIELMALTDENCQKDEFLPHEKALIIDISKDLAYISDYDL